MAAYPYKIAFRYFFARSGKTVINRINRFAFLMVVIATASLFIVLSAFEGLKEFGVSFSASFDPDYEITPEEGKYFIVTDSLLAALREIPEIIAVAPLIEEKVFLSYEEKNQVAFLKGVSPNYTEVVAVEELIALGDWLTFNGAEVVLGFGIAGNLGAGIYDYSSFLKLTVPKKTGGRILGQNPFNQESAVVVGLYQINEELDKKYVFSQLEFAQKLLALGSQQYSMLALKTAPNTSKAILFEQIETLFKEGVRVQSRAEQNAALYKMLNMEHLAIYLIFSLVMMIALFNVIGALIMMILDKQDQLKILYAMGATPQGIHRIFFLLGMLICTLGGGVGLLIGSALVGLQSVAPFLSVPGTSLPYPVLFEFKNIGLVLLTLLVLGSLSTAWATRGLNKKSGLGRLVESKLV
ncbi:MAG: ABC transporter permease [Flavobacteriaceae bacterium]